MIRNTEKDFAMAGSVPTIMTDLTVIIRNINEQFQKECGMTEEEVKDMIQHCVNLAFKPKDELVKYALDKVHEKMGNEPRVVLDFLKAMLGIDDEESKDKSDADFRVWCETNEIRDEVLKKFDSDGLRWSNGKNPCDFKNTYVFNAPMGLHISEGKIFQSSNRGYFDDDDSKEVKAEDLLNEKVGGKHE